VQVRSSYRKKRSQKNFPKKLFKQAPVKTKLGKGRILRKLEHHLANVQEETSARGGSTTIGLGGGSEGDGDLPAGSGEARAS